MELQEKVNHFPARPGVYRMHGAQGTVLYVGKAKNLRARVRSYFREGADGRPQVRFLMGKVTDIDFVVTDNEKEALILENTLIKRHRPRYNVDLRDDKTYLSLRLDVRSPFPRLTTTRQVRRDGALYFGPYSSARALRETVDLIHELFPLRQCSDRELKSRTRPCLYCQIRGCRAPCCGLIDQASYDHVVDQVVLFLKGRGAELVGELERAMARAAESLDFEEAARLRDQVGALKLTLERQKAVSHKPEDRDVVAMLREGAEAQFTVLVIRSGNLIGRRPYYLADAPPTDPEAMTGFLQQYYRGDRIVPPEVLVSICPGDEERALLEEWLADRRGRRVKIRRPQRGEKAALLRMAEDNAAELLAERRRTKVGYEAALTELQLRLHLPAPPRRMECYDISNVQGKQAVGSMVTFVDGYPFKAGYRRFAIRNVAGADDFAMLYEVVSRRLKRAGEGWALPDLMLIDGGKGQLGMVGRALADAGVEGVALASLAKARTLPGNGEEVRRSAERVFLPGRKNPVVLATNSSGLFLLQRIRDEAHRFAVEYHRKRRDKVTLRTVLESVPGVGKKRAAALLRHFGSVQRVRRASVSELVEAPGISTRLAEVIAAELTEQGGRKTAGNRA